MKKYLKYLILGIIAVLIYSLLLKNRDEINMYEPRTYEEIIQSGVLRAVTEYNSVSYHAQADTVGGFHYELLSEFAKEKNLRLEITPEMSLPAQLKGLAEGKYDILANSIPVTSELKDSLLFTQSLMLNKQVLIQRKPTAGNDSTYIDNLLKLKQKTIHISKGSPIILRIKNLSNEIGDTIYINEIEKYGSEHLLALVANGDIDYAVCDESIALHSINGLPQLDISIPIGFTQFHSWGINPSNTTLLNSLNNWLNRYKQTESYKQLTKKYLP